MFEDALLESAGRLKTQSKLWTLGALFLNSGLLAIFILLPLYHPEALPKAAMAVVMIAPPPAPAPVQAAAAAQPARSASAHPIVMPTSIPTIIRDIHDAADPGPTGPVGNMPGSGSNIAGNGNILDFIGPTPPIVVTKPRTGPVRVSSVLVAGNLITQTLPVYPPIAIAAHITGAVVLHAIISKTGTIEDLVVVSGSPMLRQAALNGVRNWRYKPFLLNGDPTEVDTTITVNFTTGS